jgi:hypothetical protein
MRWTPNSSQEPIDEIILLDVHALFRGVHCVTKPGSRRSGRPLPSRTDQFARLEELGEADVAAGPFDREILEAAAEYKSWGRVDDEIRWAPTLCRAPRPGRVYPSASDEDQTHGKKLYSLFARERDDYVAHTHDQTVDVGQAVVKQSWLPEEITDPKEKPRQPTDRYDVAVSPGAYRSDGRKPRDPDAADHFYPYVWLGDKVFKAAKQAELFVMLKLDPETHNTDGGWVYATVTPDGKKVTSAGMLESCIRCHSEATSDRLFGLSK